MLLKRHIFHYTQTAYLVLSYLRNMFLITELILEYWGTLDSTGIPTVLTIACVPSWI